MAVVSYGLYVEQESHQETNQYREELYARAQIALVAEHNCVGAIPAGARAARHQDGDEGAEHDCSRG
nr:hypothetical protein Itr_chr13CG20150 [Ipomoea trifida]